MLVIDENESFNMQANVTSKGYQRMVLSGMMVRRRGGKTEYTTLLPSYFYGWGGGQLSTWRQYIGATGSQTILSRSGGKPEPSGQRIWKELKTPEATKPIGVTSVMPPYGLWLIIGLVGAGIIYLAVK